MPKIRLTKMFEFEMAHALWNYDGKCKHIHGHSYKLHVTLIGEPISDVNNSKLGMVMDFGDLKTIINDVIISKYDHALVLNQNMPGKENLNTKQLFDKCIFVDYQPTCENMIYRFADFIKDKLPKNVKLYGLKLFETATSYAEWFASDNEESKLE